MAQGGGQAAGLGGTSQGFGSAPTGMGAPMGGAPAPMTSGVGGMMGAMPTNNFGPQLQGPSSLPPSQGGTLGMGSPMGSMSPSVSPMMTTGAYRGPFDASGMPALTGGMSGFGGALPPMGGGMGPNPYARVIGGDVLMPIPGQETQFAAFNQAQQRQGQGQLGNMTLGQLLSGLGYSGYGGGIPPMQTDLSQAIQSPAAAPVTAPVAPPVATPAAAPAVMATPAAPVMPRTSAYSITPEQARQMFSQPTQQPQRFDPRKMRRPERDRFRRRGAPAAPNLPTSIQMGEAGQFGGFGFDPRLEQYLGSNYGGYKYSPTTQTFYQNAPGQGSTLTLDQALQQGRAAGLGFAGGGIASLLRRR